MARSAIRFWGGGPQKRETRNPQERGREAIRDLGHLGVSLCYEGFQQFGAAFGSLYNKHHSILGFILGPLVYGNPPYEPKIVGPFL